MSNPSPSPQSLHWRLLQAFRPSVLTRRRRGRRWFVETVVSVLPGLAAAVAIWTFGAAQRDPLEAAESMFLTGVCGWVLTWVGVAAGAGNRWPALAAAACLATIWIAHGGPHRGGWISGILAACVLWIGAGLWRRRVVTPGRFFAWSAAWQGLFLGSHMLSWNPALLVDLLLWPSLATVIFSLGARYLGSVASRWSCLPALAMLGPWGLGSLAVQGAGLAAVKWLRWIRPADHPQARARGKTWQSPAAGALVLAVGLWMLPGAALAGYPWFRAWPAVTAAPADLWAPVEVLLQGDAISLHGEQTSRSLEWQNPESSVRSVVLETDLVHGADLPPGTPVLELRLLPASKDLASKDLASKDLASKDLTSKDLTHKDLPAELLAGVDTDDWASGRADLLALPGRPQVPVWRYRVVPDGSFFSRIFRTRVELPVGTAEQASSLELRRSPDLPDNVQIRIHRVEVRR